MSDRYSTRRQANKWQYLEECIHQQAVMFLEDEEDCDELVTELLDDAPTERRRAIQKWIDEGVELIKREVKAQQDKKSPADAVHYYGMAYEA